MKIGLIGCGNISNAYFNGGKHASNLEVVACADIKPEAAQAKAQEHGATALSVDELLAHPEIELIVNLTIPQAHVPVGLQILEAGKHLYAEKPLALTFDEGKQLVDSAAARGLRVGSAPDTFLFGSAQTSRKILDDGWIGRVVNGTAFMACHGHETWHPNPGFFYLPGGGPLFDMGPYYLTALVNFLGPVKSVMARCNRAYEERVATTPGIEGQRLPVAVNTHCTGLLEFHNGALVTLIMSFDTWHHTLPNLTLQGTEGTLDVGDPNNFPTAPRLHRTEDDADVTYRTISIAHADNKRMIGVVDMVDAIRNGRPHRASGDLALHILEIMAAFDPSSESSQAITLTTRPERPTPLPTGLRPWVLER